jgi:hypothetical protein
MKHQISKEFVDTVIITIEDDEINSSDKEAFLDVLLNSFRDQNGSWGSRHINSDNVKYAIHKRIWDDVTFQKKYLMLQLSL